MARSSWSDPRMYLGSDGIIHGIGGGVVRIFLPGEIGQSVTDALGQAQDAGLDSLSPPDESPPEGPMVGPNGDGLKMAP